jgi:hypothetical protein
MRQSERYNRNEGVRPGCCPPGHRSLVVLSWEVLEAREVVGIDLTLLLLVTVSVSLSPVMTICPSVSVTARLDDRVRQLEAHVDRLNLSSAHLVMIRLESNEGMYSPPTSGHRSRPLGWDHV